MAEEEDLVWEAVQVRVRVVVVVWAAAQDAAKVAAVAWAVREAVEWDQAGNAYAQPVDKQRRISAVFPAPSKNAPSAGR